MTKREQIRLVQTLLTKAGYDPGPIDGFMGEKTETAVKQYQKSKGWAESGKVTEMLVINMKDFES